MIASLNEALAQLNLQPGETFRTIVRGRELEVRALEIATTTPPDEDRTKIADGELMLEPWFTIPSPRVAMVTAKWSPLPWPDPPTLPPAVLDEPTAAQVAGIPVAAEGVEDLTVRPRKVLKNQNMMKGVCSWPTFL